MIPIRKRRLAKVQCYRCSGMGYVCIKEPCSDCHRTGEVSPGKRAQQERDYGPAAKPLVLHGRMFEEWGKP